MKRIFIAVMAISSIVSCSWIDSKMEKEMRDEAEKAKTEIQKIAKQEVSNARTLIDSSIAKSVRKANNNIDTLVEKSIEQIKLTTDRQVQEAIEKKVKRLDKKINLTSIIALLGVLSGLAGLFVAKMRERKLRDKIVEYVMSSHRIETYIGEYIDKRRPQTKQCAVSREDVRRMIKDIIYDSAYLEYLVKEISNKMRQDMTGKIIVSDQPPVKAEALQSSGIELYARDTQSDKLSDVSSSHQKGKTIYRLILEHQNSDIAILDVCVDKEDVVGRILRFNDEDLESVCSVLRNTERPEKVRVLKKGKAQRINNSEWKVIEKIEIELS